MAIGTWCLAAVMAAVAADNAMAEVGVQTRPAVTPVLQPDPAVMKIIDGLGEGESAVLPKLKTTGDINDVARRYHMDTRGPGARDYCIKMVWMPDRKRAIYYGANHGAPHRTNDVWEYDLPSNTWVCLYGPDLLRGKENWAKHLDRETMETGIPRTKRGGPAVNGHSWWNLTYDPGLKAMLTFCSWSMVPRDVWMALRKGPHKPPFWAFYPEKRTWQPITGSTFVGPRPTYENARALEYVPELGGTLWTKSAGVWLYTSNTNTWKRLGSSKDYGDGLPAREQVMVYVPDRQLLVAHCRAGQGKPSIGYDRATTHHYLIEKNEWRRVFVSTEKNNPPAGFDAGTNFVYDRVGKVCLLWDGSWTKALWAYDPGTTTWTRLTPKGPAPPTGRDARLAYYDVERNVFVIAGQWVYRHKSLSG